MSFVNVDLSKIEERVLASLTGCASNAKGDAFPNKLWGFVAALPKKHPFRFAMLYSAGPATAERMTRGAETVAERRVHLEAEIQCFENWQRSEDPEEGLLAKFDRMFPALKALSDGSITGRWFNRDKVTLTGRRWSSPEPQFPTDPSLRKEGYSALFGLPYGVTMKNYLAQYHAAMQSDKQENCYGEPVGEQQSDEHFRAALDSIKDWCRCNGDGFWYEQIDGPDNMRKVKCDRHSEGNQSE